MAEPSPEEIAKEAGEAAFKAAMPPPGPKFAARVGDPHICPMVDGVKPHVGGPILAGFPTVIIGGMAAARVTDVVTCVGPPDSIAVGSPTVLIGNMMAARFMDSTVHGGMIVMGCPTVVIGDVGAGGSSGTSGIGASVGLTAFCPLIAILNDLPLAGRLQAEQMLMAVLAEPPASLSQLMHDRNMAILAGAPYARSDGSPPVLPPGYAPATSADLARLGLDPSLLHPDIQVYSTTNPDNSVHYVMSYRGTELGAGAGTAANDIGTDVLQALGFNTDAYKRGNIAASRAALSGESIELTGHSKGGGQAAAGSAASGLPATTFNAAGVHRRTLDRANVTDAERAAAETNIRAYHNERDPLNRAQDNRDSVISTLAVGAGAKFGLLGAAAVAALGSDGALPQALGQRIPVPPASDQGNGLSEGHSIDVMIQALNEQATDQLGELFGC